MGNCICMNVTKKSSTEWGGEEWGSVLSPPVEDAKQPEYDFRREKKTEVKVKITKKQLEELLHKVGDGQHGESLNQVLTQLMSMNPHTTTSSWRPALHSIPESEEY